MNSYQYHDCHHPFQHFHHSHDNYLNISGLNIITWWTISIGMMRHLLVNLCAVLQQKVDHHQVVIQDRLEGKEISKLVDFINSKYFLYIFYSKGKIICRFSANRWLRIFFLRVHGVHSRRNLTRWDKLQERSVFARSSAMDPGAKVDQTSSTAYSSVIYSNLCIAEMLTGTVPAKAYFVEIACVLIYVKHAAVCALSMMCQCGLNRGNQWLPRWSQAKLGATAINTIEPLHHFQGNINRVGAGIKVAHHYSLFLCYLDLEKSICCKQIVVHMLGNVFLGWPQSPFLRVRETFSQKSLMQLWNVGCCETFHRNCRCNCEMLRVYKWSSFGRLKKEGQTFFWLRHMYLIFDKKWSKMAIPATDAHMGLQPPARWSKWNSNINTEGIFFAFAA